MRSNVTGGIVFERDDRDVCGSLVASIKIAPQLVAKPQADELTGQGMTLLVPMARSKLPVLKAVEKHRVRFRVPLKRRGQIEHGDPVELTKVR